MPNKFVVPKFITIEDKLLGVITFKQLFSLLGVFLLSFIIFKINQIAGIIVGIILFVTAFILIFVKINGKFVINILPSILDFLFKSRRLVWQRMQTIEYKEIPIPEEKTEPLKEEPVKPRSKTTIKEQTVIELNYPHISPNIKEKVVLSLNQPISSQINQINKVLHRHIVNPKNPYRFFPYVKLYKKLK